MALNRYNRQTKITSGYTGLSMANKVRQGHQARVDGDYSEAQRIFDDIAYIFQEEHIDLNKATPVINSNKINYKQNRKESTKLTNLLTRLHSENFFDSVPGSGFTANSAIEKAIDFNEKIVYNQQGVSTFASYTDVIGAYERLQEMKKDGPGNFLYLFDTETIGGKNTSNIWNPLGITEFAMQKVDLTTNAVTKTNIVLGVADTQANKDTVEKILNALGTSLDPKKANSASLKQYADPSVIMNDEELRVTAYRYAIYGSKESIFEDVLDGSGNVKYKRAKSLASSDLNDWLDPEKIKAGYLKNIEAYQASPMTDLGFNKAQKEFIDSIAEMTKMAQSGKGMIGGQNIVPFDIPVVNTELTRIKKSLQDVIDGKGDGTITGKQARAGLDYLNKQFNGNIGLSAPSNQIYDTLPMINFIRDTFGLDALYGGNQEAIMAAANGTAKQENVGAVWFPKLFASGEAHMADFDVDVQRAFFTSPIEELGGKTFMEHFMEVEDNGGLKALNLQAQIIEAGGEQQLLYAKKGTRDRPFMGKGALDHTYNSKTGEIFFGSNYEIMNHNSKPKFAGDINMGTHITKGNFYYVDSIKKMKAEDISKDLGDVLPELSGPEVYQVRMRRAVSDKHKGKGLEDLEYVFHFNNEYEMSGWFSSNYDMPLIKDDNGNWVVTNQDAYDVLEQVTLKDGQIEREAGFYLKDPKEMLEKTLEAKDEKTLADRALRDIEDPAKRYNKIKSQLDMRLKLDKAGLDNVSSEELKTILSGKPIERMKNMDIKEAEKLISDVRDIAGFKPNGIGDTKLYSNTVNKISSSWDLIGKQDEFYSKVIANLDKYTETNHYTKVQRQAMFDKVVENLKAQVADTLYENPNDVRNAVYSSKAFQGSLNEIMNVYDIELPDNFIIEQAKLKTVETGLNLNANKNLISVRLDGKTSSSSAALVDQLVKAKYGDRNLKINPDNYKHIALYDFVNHLSTLDEFKDSKGIREAIEHMNMDTKHFSLDTVARSVIEEMQNVKRIDPSKGVLRDISMRTLESIPEFNKALNELTESMIRTSIENTPVPLAVGGTNATNDVQNYIKTNVLKKYMPSRKDFEKTLEGLNDEQKWQKNLLYNTLEEQITNRLVDVTETLSAIPNSELYIAENGNFIFKQGQKAVNIDAVPKIFMNGDDLYGQVGRSPVQVHLDYGIKTGGSGKGIGTYVTTNLGESFDRGKIINSSIRRKLKDGTFRTEDALSITANLSKDFRQDSRYEFKSGDWFSNFMVGTGELDTIMPRLFGVDGDLQSLVPGMDLPEDVVQVLKDNFKYVGKEIEAGGMDPVMNQYISAYRAQILQSIAEQTGTEDIQRLSAGLTIGTKGKGKLQVGKMMGSNMRFTTGTSDKLDNLGRPVVDGSGNVKFIPTSFIEEAIDNARHGAISKDPLISDIYSDRINKRIADGVGEITTGWTSRTAYVGEYGIKAIIENNFNKVMNNNSIKNLSQEKKENIYNMLTAYVNTFEQQKIFDAKLFDDLTNGGTMAANVIKLSSAKDIVNTIKDEADAARYQRLMDLMGDIQIDSKGKIEYKSAVGEIVKRGDTVVSFATYGGEATNWTSKMDRGLLNFQITNKQGIKLTDEQISAVLNQHKDAFKNIDLKDRKQVLKAINDSLGDYEVNFAIEDINRISLPKILANESEKSMNHLLYAKTGTVNEKIAAMFKAYSDDTAELISGTTLTPQALEAYFKDEHKRRVALKQAGFSNWKSFKTAWQDEMYTMRNVIFGKGGLFEGFSDIANDNLLGHGNRGTMLIGSLNEAVNMLGKYSNGGMENKASRQKGLEEFEKMYNANEKYQFITDSKGKGVKLKVVDGHFILEGGRGFDDSLDNSDLIDYDKLENIVRDIDTSIKGKGAIKEDWLVHNDKNLGEVIGRMIYAKDKEGDDVIVGSIGSTFHKLVNDPETQSSMPQEYFDTKMEYMKLKSKKTNLDHRYEAFRNMDPMDIDIDEFQKLTAEIADTNMRLEQMDEYLKNMEGTGHAFRIGDQEEKIIKNYFLNKDTNNAVQERIRQGKINQSTVDSNESLRKLARYAEEENEPVNVFGDFIDDLHKQRYYNPYEDSRKLTKDMVENVEKYSHLKGVYDTIVGSGQSNVLGLETAELLHNVEMASLANEYNNLGGDIEKLRKAGFKEMTPDQYINQFGDPGIPGYDSVFKENVLLKLDMGDGQIDYVAVPGMGSVMDKAEIKQDWHNYAGRLSKVYQEEYLPQHGAPIDRDKVINKIEDIKRDLRKSTAGYIEKGTAIHDRARQQVYASVDRVKIMSTTDSPLLEQAMVDGKSIADWKKAGVYYDYSFDSMEAFEKRGFFRKDYLEKMNMTREEMIEHLRTEGVMMMDDRYPNIRERSITPIRHYLAVDNEGMSFIGGNVAMMAPHTMLAMNADSDGDSVSRFMIKNKNVDGVQFGVARKRAIDIADTMEFENIDLRDNWIRTETIKNIESMGIKKNYAEQAFDSFEMQEIKMAQLAANENINWQNKVVETFESDAKKTKKAMSIKVGNEYSAAEVAGGRSILGHTSVTALSETPSMSETKLNAQKVNNMLSVIQKNAQEFDGNTKEYIKDILEGSTDIVSYNDESKTLDQALYAYNKLVSAGKVEQTAYGEMQSEAIKRIRIGKLHSEGAQKLGVTATGNVNSTLYGISQAIKSHYGDSTDPLYNELKRSITSEMSYLLEETPISYKKESVKAGDLRLVEFGKIFRDVEQKGLTDETREAMEGYFKRYMNHDQITDAYKMIQDKMGTPLEKRLTDPEKIVNEMITSYTNFIGEALDPSSELYEEVRLSKSFGRRTAQANAMANAGGRVATNASNAAEAAFVISGKHTPSTKISDEVLEQSIRTNAREAAENFTPPPVGNKIGAELAESASNTVSKAMKSGGGGWKAGLAVGAVSLAAGLIAAGYASGNPLNDANPETITPQKGFEGVSAAPEMMFSSGGTFANNNTGGYIINIKADTKKGNRQLKKALKQATQNAVGPTGIRMDIRTTQSGGNYTDQDIENILNNYF